MTATASGSDQGVLTRPSAGARSAAILSGTLVTFGLGAALEAAAGTGRLDNPFLPVIAGTALLDAVLGHLILRRHPGHPMGRVLQISGLLGAAVVLTGGHANAALFCPIPEVGAAVTLWMSRWLWVPASAVAALGLLLLFPDGRLPSARWRPAAALAVVGPLLLTLDFATLPFTDTVFGDVPVENPVGPLPSGVQGTLGALGAPLWAAGVAVGSAAVVVRWRRAVPAERPRYALVVPPAVLLPPAFLAGHLLPPFGGVLEMVAAVALSVAVTVAMLRHRMFDLDVLVNRAIVHGLLVVSLFGAYVSVVALMSELVGSESSWPAAAAAALVVAAAAGPLLTRLRLGVDRLMYGDRARPDAVVTRLAAATTAETPASGTATDVLGAAADALREALRVPWVRVEVGADAGQAGEPRTAGRQADIQVAGRTVGRVRVGARWEGERSTDPDERALEAAARQLAVTAEVYLLARRLAEARERLVGAREDERRRIRRDLHDGLGPALAGITAALEGLEAVSRDDPAAATAALPGLRARAREAVGDVRRLVDGLRPQALDELGLSGALREELRRLEQATGVPCTLDAPEPPPPLPAAVEVAALRIVLEAATNVVRHASAGRCAVRLTVDEERVAVRVEDDGCGIPADAVPGVGLSSMRERAEEVGGAFGVRSRPGGGTTVSATLPLSPTSVAAR